MNVFNVPKTPEFNIPGAQPNILNNGKHKLESSTHEEEPDLKRSKIESVSPLLGLPNELICYLVAFFSLKDLLNFELSFKEAKNYTVDFWKRKSAICHLDFPFALCEDLADEKERVVFVSSLVHYIFDTTKYHLSLEEADALQKKYSYPMSRFPMIRQIILEDLFRMTNGDEICDFADISLNSTIYQNAVRGVAGEAFLRGWKSIRRGFHGYGYIKKAVIGGATVAGLYATTFSKIPREKVLKLAILCADRNDHQALDQLLSNYPEMAQLLEGKPYPSLLCRRIVELRDSKEYTKIIPLSRQAFSAYGRNVPGLLYECVGDAYFHQNEFGNAAIFYRCAIQPHGEKIPFGLLLKAVKANTFLKNYEEAELFCKKFSFEPIGKRVFVNHYNKDEVQEALEYVGLVKMGLKKYEEALFYFNNFKRGDPNKRKLELRALAKLKLKRYEEADLLYSRISEKFGKIDSVSTLCEIAHLRFKLNQLQESVRYYQCAFHLSEENSPIPYKRANRLFTQLLEKGENHPNILSMAAKTKMQLKEYVEADLLYGRLHQILKDKTSKETLSDAAIVKLHLKKYPEADQLFDLIPEDAFEIERYRNKIQLEKWNEAEVIIQKFVEKLKLSGQSALPELRTLAYVKSKLGKWEEADALFKQYCLTENDCPIANLYNNAFIKFRLNQIEIATDLFKKAIKITISVEDQFLNQTEEFFQFLAKEKPLVVDELEALGKLNYLLKNFEEADKIYAQILSSPEIEPITLVYASHVKYELKEYELSEELLDQALGICKNNINFEIWLKAASLKRLLGDIDETNRLFDQLMPKFAAGLNLGMLEEILFVKMKLKKWNQAQQISAMILKKFSNSISFVTLVAITTVKIKLGLPESKELLKKVHDETDESNINHLIALAVLHLDLEQFEESDNIFKKIQGSIEEMSYTVLINWTIVKFHLGQLEETVALYEQIKASKKRIPKYLLQLIAELGIN